MSLQSVVVITDHGFAPVQLLEGLTANRAVRRMFALQYVLETELVQQKGLCFSSVHFQKWVNAAIKVMCWKLLMKCLRETW